MIPSRSGRAWRVLPMLVVVVMASIGGSCEDAREVSVTFENGTDQHVVFLVAAGSQTFEQVVEQRFEFPRLHPPGGSFLHSEVWRAALPEDGEPFCVPNRTYYFAAPTDPDLAASGAADPAVPFDADAIEIVHVIETPCWPALDGNRHVVTDDR